ncbi:MAG: protein translocase subunit SecD [Ilumatobacter sp.]|uniref:protein translocase subunit SecD n=1 Tax=Ilumatobacter sp. TaxID=1967498 RepID=UPI003C7743ED
MKRRLWLSLIATTLIIIVAFAGNLASSNTPKLGLDLQGGASVILEPAEDASGEDLTIVRDLIRDELERTGIAEPNVRVQGATIVVELPGVKDQQEALDAVDVSGIVELRPVVFTQQCQDDPLLGGADGGGVEPPTSLGVEVPQTAPELELDVDPAVDAPAADDSAGDEAVPADTEGVRRKRTVTTDEPVTTDAESDEPVTTDAESDEPVDSTPADDAPVDEIPVDEIAPDFSETEFSNGNALLFTREGEPLCVGPVQGTGEVFERQSAVVDNQLGFQVIVGLRGGDGEATWNNIAGQCASQAPTCPGDGAGNNGRLAIVLDGEIQSAPTVQQANFRDTVSITGRFSQEEAENLANILNRGAFPVEMVAQDSETISPAAGQESLRASIIAGLIGVAIVLTFLIAYYRWIALVILGGMTVWSLTVFSVAAFVSGATNYSLSLAGVTGIIVAVGVTVDSYIVFFERMKDEIRNGRTLKNAAPRSFKMTWRTIWSADLVSIIGAAILFWLSVGSVRGFALFLGITTLCDLIVCFFFTRPAVLLLARSKFMAGRRAFGLEVAQ